MNGLTDEQLNELDKGTRKSRVSFTDDEMKAHETLIDNGLKADEFLAKPWYKQLLTTNVVKESPKALIQTLIGTPAKWGASVLASPIDIARGIAGKSPMQGQISIPGLQPSKTIQAEQYDRSGKIIEGELPLYYGLAGPAEAVLGGIETATLPGMATGIISGTEKGLLSLQKSIKAGQQARKIAQEAKLLKENIDIVAPKLTPNEMTEALAQGKVVNKVKPLTKTVVQDFSNDPDVVKIAQDTKGTFVGKTSSENLNLGRQFIENTSETVVKPFLSGNKVPFHYQTFIEKMNMVHPSSSFNNNPTAFQTYNRVREEIINSVAENLKRIASKTDDYGNLADLNDVWDARKILDAKATSELKNFQFGTPEYTGVKMAVQDMRSAFKDFILDSLQYPGQMDKVNKMQEFLQVFRARGGSIPNEKTAIKLLQDQFGIQTTPEDVARMAFFRDNMDKLTSYYRAVENLAVKARAEIGTNRWTRFSKKNPTTSGVIKYGLPTVGGLEVIRQILK